LSRVSWRITVQAAPGNVKEQATWLVNIALGFLRLSYPNKRYHFFPAVGDVETMPFVKPELAEQSLTITDSGISGGGRSTPRVYLVDDEMAAVTATEEFKSRAKAIFEPGHGSLAERFGQGLGWLTRGRQTDDRAERLLFFFTAIEALLSNDDKTAPVVQTIARYAAVILTDESKERIQVAADIRSLYIVRSALVHGGKRTASQDDSIRTQYIAECLYRRVMDRMPLTTTFTNFQKSLSDASYGLSWPPTSG
jgi:hypothetical protein